MLFRPGENEDDLEDRRTVCTAQTTGGRNYSSDSVGRIIQFDELVRLVRFKTNGTQFTALLVG